MQGNFDSIETVDRSAASPREIKANFTAKCSHKKLVAGGDLPHAKVSIESGEDGFDVWNYAKIFARHTFESLSGGTHGSEKWEDNFQGVPRRVRRVIGDFVKISPDVVDVTHIAIEARTDVFAEPTSVSEGDGIFLSVIVESTGTLVVEKQPDTAFIGLHFYSPPIRERWLIQLLGWDQDRWPKPDRGNQGLDCRW